MVPIVASFLDGTLVPVELVPWQVALITPGFLINTLVICGLDGISCICCYTLLGTLQIEVFLVQVEQL